MIRRYSFGRYRVLVALTAALATSGATAAGAPAAVTTFNNPTAITIPDSGPANPYPSSINVSGLAGNVQKATVTLRGFTHTCPDDLAVLLVGPTGAKSLLMGGVGGCPQGAGAPAVDLTFDQTAASALNADDYPVSGTYRPSETGTTSSLAPPAPTAPYPVDLNTFFGTPATGAWQLFIDDQASVDAGSVGGGWSLALTAPVNTLKAGKPKLNKKKGTARLPVTVGDAGQLTLRGKGVKSASASKSVAVAGPGTVKLTVKPKGKTKQKLNSTGKATVKVKIKFTPNGGTPNTRTKKIKLKKTLG